MSVNNASDFPPIPGGTKNLGFIGTTYMSIFRSTYDSLRIV